MGAAHKVSTKQWECNWVSWLRGKLQTLLKHLLKSTTIKTEQNSSVINHTFKQIIFLQTRFTLQTKCDHKHIFYTKNCPTLSSFLFEISAFTSNTFYLHVYFTLLLLSSYFYFDICHIGTAKNLHFLQKSIKEKSANDSWSIIWLLGEYLR